MHFVGWHCFEGLNVWTIHQDGSCLINYADEEAPTQGQPNQLLFGTIVGCECLMIKGRYRTPLRNRYQNFFYAAHLSGESRTESALKSFRYAALPMTLYSWCLMREPYIPLRRNEIAQSLGLQQMGRAPEAVSAIFIYDDPRIELINWTIYGPGLQADKRARYVALHELNNYAIPGT